MIAGHDRVAEAEPIADDHALPFRRAFRIVAEQFLRDRSACS